MRKKKLLWQLYPTYLVIILFSLIAVTWYASDSLRQFCFEQSAIDLQARARLLAGQILDKFASADTLALDPLCKRLGKESATRITVILPSGEVIGDTEENPSGMDNHADRPEVKDALSGTVGTSTRYSHTLAQEMMYVAIPLEDRGQFVGVLRLSVPLASIGQALHASYGRIILGGVVIAVVVALFSLWVSRRISRPLEEMKSGVEYFARGDLKHRLAVPECTEMAGLADAFNQMAHELSQRIDTATHQRNEREAILSSMVEGVMAVDKDERIISLNKAAAGMLNLKSEETIGLSVQETLRSTALQGFLQQTLTSDQPVEAEIVLADPQHRALRLTGAVLRDVRNVRMGGVVVINDVTRIRRLERLRKDFVANVSHELKTPITSIKGFVETLIDGAFENRTDALRFLETTARHVDRLNAIIEDLLLLSRLEQQTGQQEIDFEEGRIAHVLKSVAEVCAQAAAKKEISISVDCPPELTAVINRALLEQAVANLINNSITYSEPKSSIKISAFQTPEDLTIAVEDHGYGIPKEHLSRLFERFYRVDIARSRKLGGTGLGLAIVKHITQAHGGNVDVESTPGQGSTFSIHLPLA